MKLPTLSSTLLSAVLLFKAQSAFSLPAIIDTDSQDPITLPSPHHHQPSSDIETFTVPTRYQSTLLARRLLSLSSTGTLTTVFPSNLTSYPSTHIPPTVGHTPIGLPEYIASCEEPTGNPTILALGISTSTLNWARGSNVSLSVSWWDEYIHITGKRPWSQADLPRLSVTGYLEEIAPQREEMEVEVEGDESEGRKSLLSSIETCFLTQHKDSIMWLPGKKWAAHKGVWMRLVVVEAYWIGGFGDRNYIGWLDRDEWKSVTEEWKGVRLPGEKE